ncbi:MAG: acyl carrier protein [Bacteroidales bacterium]|jgi:acyl carrier protein|nr:acyl carrier protein [Bacteroidales bacterium]
MEQKEQIFAELMQLLGEVIGPEVVREQNITPDSVCSKDIEMDSIELVKYAEKVNEKYGETRDFPKWLSEMPMEQITSLKMSDIVNFIIHGDTEN